MLVQALRKGFLRPKRKRVLAGRGLPPVACNFFSFSFCFLFSSSSFMMTSLSSALAAIFTSTRGKAPSPVELGLRTE